MLDETIRLIRIHEEIDDFDERQFRIERIVYSVIWDQPPKTREEEFPEVPTQKSLQIESELANHLKVATKAEAENVTDAIGLIGWKNRRLQMATVDHVLDFGIQNRNCQTVILDVVSCLTSGNALYSRDEFRIVAEAVERVLPLIADSKLKARNEGFLNSFLSRYEKAQFEIGERDRLSN